MRHEVPFSYLERQFGEAETEAILGDLRDLVKTAAFTLGPPVQEFERRLGEMVGVRHIVATNTGTDALILALKALGVGPGDEVITQPNTFYATVGALVAVGAAPVFSQVIELAGLVVLGAVSAGNYAGLDYFIQYKRRQRDDKKKKVAGQEKEA